MLSNDCTLEDLQKQIGLIYRVNNDRLHSTTDLVLHLIRFATILLKAVRKGNTQKIEKTIPLVLGWVASIANRLSIDLEKVFLRHFPSVCPYCGKRPCVPAMHNKQGRLGLATLGQGEVPCIPSYFPSLEDIQSMMADIYPANTLVDSASHLVEETAEVSAALLAFEGTHDDELFADIELEIADVLAHICAVATCSGLSLARSTASTYKDGCPSCSSLPCACVFSKIALSC